MPTPNLFKRALQAGQPQIGLWSTLPSPYVSELLAGSGFDWLLLDTEHTPTDVPQMVQQLQAVGAAQTRTGCTPTQAVVRPAWNDKVMIKRYLDIGAQTLLLPFVQNADEARAAVQAVRYAPDGVRGMGGSMRASNFGRDAEYVGRAHEEICLLVQVETREALVNLEEIAQVDGVTNAVAIESDILGELLMVGPGAGGNATASAVLGDIADIAKSRPGAQHVPAFGRPTNALLPYKRAQIQSHEGGYFIRLTVHDRTGVFATLARRTDVLLPQFLE